MPEPPGPRTEDTRAGRFASLLARLDQAGALTVDERTLLLSTEQIVVRLEDAPHEFSLTSVVSQRTDEGKVDMTFHGAMAQISPSKAREMGRMLYECAAVAEAETMLIQFMKGQGLDNDSAAQMLQAFRRYRADTKTGAATEHEEQLLRFLVDDLGVDDADARARIVAAFRAEKPTLPESMLVMSDGKTPLM